MRMRGKSGKEKEEEKNRENIGERNKEIVSVSCRSTTDEKDEEKDN